MFKDIPYLSYSGLVARMNNSKPYHGKLTNAWPLGDRKLSTRHFRYDENSKVFDLYVGPLDRLDNIISLNYDDPASKSLLNYAHVASIHPDNTLELVTPYMWSNFMFLSEAMSRSRFHRVLSKGGAMLTTSPLSGELQEHLLFKGFRVNLDTKEVHPSTHYKTLHPKLKRKESKEYLAQFDEFVRVYNAFLTPLDIGGVRDIVTDLAQEFPQHCSEFVNPPVDRGPQCYSLPELLETLILQRRYTDAAVMSAACFAPWSLNMDHLKRFAGKEANGIKRNARDLIEGQSGKAFGKVMLRHKFEMFNYEEIPMGGKLRSSQWYIRTLVAGRDIRRL